MHDWLSGQWIVDHKIPLGQWIKVFVVWLQDNGRGPIDAVVGVLQFFIEGLTQIFLLAPPPATILIFAAMTFWWHRSWRLAALVVIALLLIVNLGYWQATMETLSLVVWSTLVSIAVGVPLGIAAAHRPFLFVLLRPVLDLMQTLPTFVYLIPTLILFGLGVVPGLISTVIFAIPAPIRLTHLGITSVPKQLIEAGQAFGATKHQLLWKVEIPAALPSIRAGITQCIMLSLSMVVIAALVAADGLGKPVVRALNTVNIPMGFEAGTAIVLLAIILDRVFKQPERIA
jgi:glycine betaine/proline transport system permease protein